MSNTEMTVATKATIPAIPVEAADNILKSAQEDAGFAKLRVGKRWVASRRKLLRAVIGDEPAA
jgi:hypothetical protein